MTTVHQIFTEQVIQTPTAVAVEHNDQTVTYQELEQLSNNFAKRLQSKIGIRELVAVYMDSSVEYVTTVLAILKSGCSFLPLSIDMPWKHTELVLRDSKVRYIITKSNLCLDLAAVEDKVDIVCIDRFDEVNQLQQQQQEGIADRTAVQGSDMAYIIYTSGSTGTPQGCMVAHRGVCNLVNYNRTEFNMGVNVKMLQYASLNFDASIFELFTSLLTGSTLVLAHRHDMLPGEPLVNLINHKKINIMLLPPSSLVLMNKDAHKIPSVRTLLVGGEKCPVGIPDLWITDERQLYNAYGPTEGTVYATIYKCKRMDAHETVPIGKALPGCIVELLDEEGNPVEDGVAGEICIGGEAVGLGYWRHEETTTDRFVKHGDNILFHTRDLAKRLSDGNIEYMGRKDNQVKVRGYRVEPEAIENALCQNRNVRSCVVVARNDIVQNQCILVAFILPRRKAEPQSLVTQLKRHAKSKLPHYMNPSIYEIVSKLPMMPNRSKVDRKALLTYPISSHLNKNNSTSSEFNSDTERVITNIFSEVLNMNVGPNDNFFNLGGTSLLAAAVVRKIEKSIGVQAPVALLFRKPTAKTLAETIENTDETKSGPFSEVVDYIAEAELDPEIVFPQRTGNEISDYLCVQNPSTIMQVFLTGATGFLGCHVLVDILERTQQSYVTCLVRANDSVQGKARIVKQLEQLRIWKPSYESRFEAVCGDIEQKYLGLSRDAFEDLASKADIVYHIAADTNYVKPYSALKTVNVTGTHEMIRFTAAGNKFKTLHYCSSMCVYGPAHHCMGLQTVAETTDFVQAMDYIIYENGYVRTKWVADYMVHSAMKKGLDALIYRPGFIQASSQTGVPNESDFLCRVIKGSIQLGCFPDMPHKYWMPVSLDYVSSAMVHISMFKARDTNEQKVFHLVPSRNSEPSTVELFEMLQRAGYLLQKVSIQCWHEELERVLDENQFDNALHPVAMFILEKVYEGRNTILELHYHTPSCTSDGTDDLLKESGIRCPPLNQKLVQHYIEQLVVDYVPDLTRFCDMEPSPSTPEM